MPAELRENLSYVRTVEGVYIEQTQNKNEQMDYTDLLQAVVDFTCSFFIQNKNLQPKGAQRFQLFFSERKELMFAIQPNPSSVLRVQHRYEPLSLFRASSLSSLEPIADSDASCSVSACDWKLINLKDRFTNASISQVSHAVARSLAYSLDLSRHCFGPSPRPSEASFRAR